MAEQDNSVLKLFGFELQRVQRKDQEARVSNFYLTFYCFRNSWWSHSRVDAASSTGAELEAAVSLHGFLNDFLVQVDRRMAAAS